MCCLRGRLLLLLLQARSASGLTGGPTSLTASRRGLGPAPHAQLTRPQPLLPAALLLPRVLLLVVQMLPPAAAMLAPLLLLLVAVLIVWREPVWAALGTAEVVWLRQCYMHWR